MSKFDEMVDGEGTEKGIVPVDPEEAQSSLQLANFSSQIEFDAEDIVIPRIRLAQGLTSEVQEGNARPGQFLLTGFSPADQLTIIPVGFARNRTLRDDQGAVLCKSGDSHTGVGTPGGDCAHCPMNQWADGPKGERIPPLCVFSYVYICYVVEFKSLGLVEFRRTSIQAGKTLNTIAAQRGGLGKFAVQLSGKKETGKRGTFYQMLVTPISPAKVDPQDLADAAQFMS